MNRKSSDLGGESVGGGGFNVRDQFRVVLLYDEAEAGRRGMNQLRKVMKPLGDDFRLHIGLWRFDMVLEASDPAEATAATVATELTQADLLLLALDGAGDDLGERARQWIEGAIQQMRRRGSAVALSLKSEVSPGRAGFDFLHAAAEEAGVELVLPPAGCPPAGTQPAFSNLERRARMTSQLLEEILHNAHSPSRWGINE